MIPDRAHFFWLGGGFPFTHYLALRSLDQTTRPAEIRLCVSENLSGLPFFEAALRDIPSLRVVRLDPSSLWDVLEGEAGVDVDGLRAAVRLLQERKIYAALSDILRYLALWREGGLYLDLDTITVKNLRPLFDGPGFCGREHILVPHESYRRKGRAFRTVPLDLARRICSAADGGVGWFSKIARFYPAAINNAVLGLEKGHELALEALRRIPALIPELARRRTALGPDLLQSLVEGEGGDLTVYPPRYFYPLGPYLAAHFFRTRKDVEGLRDQVLHHDTHLVHWYNDNLRRLPRPPDPDTVRSLASRQLFSLLALPFLPETSN